MLLFKNYINSDCLTVNVWLFQVILPTGSTLTVGRGRGGTKNFMNVWFKASAVDYGHTEGMILLSVLPLTRCAFPIKTLFRQVTHFDFI